MEELIKEIRHRESRGRLRLLAVPDAILEWAMLVAYNRGRMDIIKETDLYKKYQKMCDIQGRLFELVISIGTGTIIKMNPAAGFISRPM